MFGGGGAVSMIQSLRNNKKMLRRKRLFDRDAAFLGTTKENFKGEEGKIDEKKATLMQLREIREKVIGRNRRSERKNILIAFIIILPLLYYVTLGASTIVSQEEMTAQEKQLTKKNMENFHFFCRRCEKVVTTTTLAQCHISIQRSPTYSS